MLGFGQLGEFLFKLRDLCPDESAPFAAAQCIEQPLFFTTVVDRSGRERSRMRFRSAKDGWLFFGGVNAEGICDSKAQAGAEYSAAAYKTSSVEVSAHAKGNLP